jgi:hypothetical protein
MDKDDRIVRRYYLLSNIESIINDSIYFRNNSKYMNTSSRVNIGSIEEKELKKKIL